MKLGKRLEIGLKNVLSAVARTAFRSRPVTAPRTISRVLFIRYGGIGDMILSLPVFRAACARHPQARIDVLCDRKNAAPVLGTGLVDHVYYYEKNPWKVAWLVFRLRRARYDYLINLVVYPSFTFGVLARLIGRHAVRVAGDQGEFSYFYNRLVDLPPKKEIHMLKRLFLLAAEITGPVISPVDIPWMEYSDEIKHQARELFDTVRRGPDRQGVVAVNLSAGLPRREWPAEKYAQFLEHAAKSRAGGMHWCVFSDPSDPDKASRFAGMVSIPIAVLPAIKDFRVLMEFIRLCDLLVTPDTSFSHAASAMGTPVLDLMIGENVTTWAPIGVPHRIVVSTDPKNLSTLPVEDVVRSFEELIAGLRDQTAVTEKRA